MLTLPTPPYGLQKSLEKYVDSASCRWSRLGVSTACRLAAVDESNCVLKKKRNFIDPPMGELYYVITLLLHESSNNSWRKKNCTVQEDQELY